MSTDSYSGELFRSARESQELPLPGAMAQQHSEALIKLIKNEIDSNKGKISFQRYMELALYAPGLGYYTAGSLKFGEAGDFVTAPEISTLFSYAMANAILPVLESEMVILEAGAGRGRMAADILSFLQQQDHLPAEYWILELSADLRQRQKQTIEAAVPGLMDKVKWLDELPEEFSGVVLANELLDAMPVQLFQKMKNDINDVNVIWKNDRFTFQFDSSFDERLTYRVNEIEQEKGNQFPAGYISEINFVAEDWLKSISERLQKGVIVLVDYGFPRHEYYHEQRNEGTLMCHYQHRTHPDVFVYPGLQDITAHVDFTAIADAALESGLKVLGYTTQVNFLMGAGLIELSALNEEQDIQKQMEIAAQIKKLTLPHEMGELFKVIGLSRNCDVSLPAFEFRDLREHL